ncbi:3-isopropylmalate/3-methylmalate dehydrogenase [Candidatus Methanobinarius endosymbioticus]|uniref:3-isopropylmalate/3-methylmalate dehydrogenase n=1 Tax=Candidatus Methanobinarius endosymbioticus TaxID=2006182 RepID=A0A366MEI7_9EURY|nr:3-isopropylmalate/3-methylmalate dehydrogenase [Candidatus Methanobinarius endosymbioticus]
MRKITTIAGDGIGKEVMESGLAILKSLDLNFNFREGKAGYECFQKNGTTIPEETIKNAKNSQATLYGATTSTPNEKSPIIILRKELDVFANLRPVKSFEGVDSLFKNLDFLIVRENTEGLYSEIEIIENENIENNKNNSNTKAKAIKVITKEASERICAFAYRKAIEDNKKRVTCVHKANVLKKTDGIFKESFYKIANKYSKTNPQILANDYYVDATAMYLITKPAEFQVIVTSNLYGDILSDEGAGLVGGLGFSPSANIGDDNGLFEPVHGSAPEIAGQGIANPIAMILSVAMMLDFLKEKYYANQIRLAVENVLKKGKIKTPDLGGNSKTSDMTNAIVNELNNI